MTLKMSLRKGLPIFLFLVCLVGYANGRISPEYIDDIKRDNFSNSPEGNKADAAFLVGGHREAAEVPFRRGVNLTNWLQAPNVRQIQFTKFTKQDFINIKRLGCDVIRLPINLHHMTSGLPDYTIDPLFFYFLDQIIDWAGELEIHLILDNHTFDPSESTNPGIVYALVPVWTQMARRYNDRSTYLYYEVLNEPHGISDAKWNEIQQEVVEAIREVDRTHTIIVGPAGWNNQWQLLRFPLNEFSERDAWDHGWYPPIGAYDWSATERFEIVSEHSDLKNEHFYFNNIRIVEPDSPGRR